MSEDQKDPQAGADGSAEQNQSAQDSPESGPSNNNPPEGTGTDNKPSRGKASKGRKLIEIRKSDQVLVPECEMTEKQVQTAITALCKEHKCEPRQLQIIDVNDPNRPRFVTLVLQKPVTKVERVVLRGPYMTEPGELKAAIYEEAVKLLPMDIRKAGVGKKATREGKEVLEREARKLVKQIAVEVGK